ncbi:MAG TPA: hypothetical protein VG737_02800 [Cyclobacteriaceae bacterium]|nr:hypothetical protein [Cyclobacteriaceae bacterium]
MTTLKSIGAVLAGIIANIILSVGTDVILIQSGIAPEFTEAQPWPAKVLAFATVYRTIYGVFGGYITALAAPQNPMRHVAILGILGTIATIVGLLTHLGQPDTWYPALLAITAFPACWLGGKLMVRQKGKGGNQ